LNTTTIYQREKGFCKKQGMIYVERGRKEGREGIQNRTRKKM
jgi:hypothetical protein